ncbi:MAG: M56 family metallopeptidase [Acidobacteriota bacterium]|jgi:beta-lactamase regulating signal transducer with metallopeptidase domain
MLPAIDVALKGAVVLGAAAATARMLRSGAAATRYLVWSTALAALLALPLLSALVPAWTAPWLPEVPQSWAVRDSFATVKGVRASEQQKETDTRWMLPHPVPRAPAAAPTPQGSSTAGAVTERPGARRESSRPPVAPPPALRWNDEAMTTGSPASEADTQASPSLQRATLPANAVPTWPALLAGIYLCGVAVLLLQLAAGTVGVLRVLRVAEPVADGPLRRDFEQAVAALGIERGVRLLQTDASVVPLAWELLRPAVLMPVGAHRWPAERRRVALLHELAHVRRRDCQLQFVAWIAVALHWLNPLAWLALRRMREEREHACDDAVLELGTRASDYADHLLQIARGLLPSRGPAWASLAMARTPHLEGRVAAILDPLNARRLPQRRTIMTALISALLLLLPLAGLQPGVAAQTTEQAATPSSHISAALEHLSSVVQHFSAVATHFGAPAGHSGAAAEPLALSAAQSGEPTIDELIQMRIHGVSTDFIEEVRAAFGRSVTVRDLVQMRIHGATPEFVRGLQELFDPDDVTIQEVTNLRIHGASLDYIRAMRDELGGDITPRDITNMRIHGATPDYVASMQAALDGDVTVRDITNMRIHGVTTEMVRDLQEDGFDNLTADDLVKMKIQGFDRWLQRRRGGR